jgi:hypothetical protein
MGMHVYEVRPRKDHRGVELISDVLPFGRLWYGEPNAIHESDQIRDVHSPSRTLGLILLLRVASLSPRSHPFWHRRTKAC